MTVTESEIPVTDASPAEAPADTDGKTSKKGKKGKKEKGGKSNLVPAIVLAVGIAAGGWFMGGSGDSGDAATVTTVEPEVVEGPLLAVEPMTVNLAGGRYLRVAVSFQMTDAYEDVVEGEEGDEFAHHDASRVRDMLISLFAGRDAGSLTQSEGRSAVKGDLHAHATEMFDGEVMEVFFTEFVIQ